MEIFNVCWSNYNKENNHIIGFLIYDDHWFFKYNEKVIQQAIRQGFRPFVEMSDLSILYDSLNLFPIFRTRYKIMDDDSVISFMKNNSGDLITDKILIKHMQEKMKNI